VAWEGLFNRVKAPSLTGIILKNSATFVTYNQHKPLLSPGAIETTALWIFVLVKKLRGVDSNLVNAIKTVEADIISYRFNVVTAIKPPHPGTLTLSPERQSARMSKITNDGLPGLAEDAF